MDQDFSRYTGAALGGFLGFLLILQSGEPILFLTIPIVSALLGYVVVEAFFEGMKKMQFPSRFSKKTYVKVCPNCGSTNTTFDYVYRTSSGGFCNDCAYRGAVFPEMIKKEISTFRKHVRPKGAYRPTWKEYPLFGKLYVLQYIGILLLGILLLMVAWILGFTDFF